MAKQKGTSPKSPTRRQVARRVKEERLSRILIWSAIGVAALIVLIIGYGLLTELVIKARQPVARIDGNAITTQQYQQRLYYERLLMRQQLNVYQSYLFQLDPTEETMQSLYQQIQFTVSNLESQLAPNMASLFGKQVLDTMLEEELVRQEAAARNLVVSKDEVTLAIEEMLGYDRAAETITDTTTVESFDTLYKDFNENILKPSRFSERDFRAMVETSLLREQLQALVGADIAQTSDQVETVFLAVDSEETGLALRELINLGAEDPFVLIEELNNDGNDQTAGYALPWMPVGYLASQLGMDIERVAFNTPVGKASEPTLGNDGQLYVIYVSGHEERPLDEAMLRQMRQETYATWLETQKARWEYLNWQAAVLTAP